MVFSGGIDSKIVQFQQITNKVQCLLNFVIDVSYNSQVQSNISIDKCIT